MLKLLNHYITHIIEAFVAITISSIYIKEHSKISISQNIILSFFVAIVIIFLENHDPTIKKSFRMGMHSSLGGILIKN